MTKNKCPNCNKFVGNRLVYIVEYFVNRVFTYKFQCNNCRSFSGIVVGFTTTHIK